MKAALAVLIAGFLVVSALSGCIFQKESKEKPGESEPFVFDPASFVNPMVGTDFNGHTFPGATIPFGMVQLSPDTGTTGWNHCSGYNYSDKSIIGFSHTHLSGTGCLDYGDILIMPETGELQIEPGDEVAPETGYRSAFSHEKETAAPGYYFVHLDDCNVDVELTATARVGIHRYTFHKSEGSRIIIDLAHGMSYSGTDFTGTTDAKITITGDRTVEGYRASNGWVPRRVVYFVAEFSKPFASYGTWNEGYVREGNRQEIGRKIGAFLNFDIVANESIVVKVGISFVSVEGARANLEAEAQGWDFDEYRRKARDAWNKELGKIEVFGGTEEQKKVFYTALYHSMIAPNVFSDVTGQYMGPDWSIRTSDVPQYTVFSLWDTFRALHPLLTIIQPKRNADMIDSMVNIYKNRGGYATGRLPRWWLANGETECMTGTHAASVIADAYVKGITGFDAATAYEGMCKDSTVPGVSVVPYVAYGSFGEGRYGLVFYNSLGYVPADIAVPYDNPLYVGAYAYNQAVSRTLEYAYDDYCIAQMAKAMGNTADYETYLTKSKNYINLYDAATGFMRGKSVSGRWMDEGSFDPTVQYAYYTEGNAWQWTWFVPHDVPGLIELMGGKEKFVEKLDALFAQPSKVTASHDVSGLIGQYAHGNEPVHHVAYLYALAGQPWKTQEKVRQIMATLYNSGNAGLCGNDDCGQMSAWYVLSAMGFYQVCPGNPTYCIGSPIFDKVIVHLENGKKFIIEAKHNSAENKYIQHATINGELLEKPWFEHKNIVDGGRLIFEMGSTPNMLWGTQS